MEWILFQNEEVEIFMSCGVSPRWHGGGYFPKVLCFKSWIWLTRRYWALVLGWRERLLTADQLGLRSRALSTNQEPWQSQEPWYKPCDMEYNNIITSLLIPLLPLKHRMERQQEEMSSISKVWTTGCILTIYIRNWRVKGLFRDFWGSLRHLCDPKTGSKLLLRHKFTLDGI